MHLAKMKTRKNVNQSVVVRNKPLTSPTAFAFSVFYNTVRKKCRAFYTIALPVYLRHYSSKGDPQLKARGKRFLLNEYFT